MVKVKADSYGASGRIKTRVNDAKIQASEWAYNFDSVQGITGMRGTDNTDKRSRLNLN